MQESSTGYSKRASPCEVYGADEKSRRRYRCRNALVKIRSGIGLQGDGDGESTTEECRR